MKDNKEQLFEIYISNFNAYVLAKRLKNKLFSPNEETINESIRQTEELLYKLNNEEKLSDEDKADLTNKIKSIYSIYQEEGYAILGDYEHDYEWYNTLKSKKDFKEYYWDRYKNYLLINKHFSTNVLNTLDKDTSKIMSYLGNPNEEDKSFSIRGLVVGDVQSGKTSNYLGLLSKAADSGYKIIIVLTGTIENLRKQTQIRIEEGFIGYDSVNGNDVGVKRGSKTPKAFTSREKDFTGKDNQNTTYKISSYFSEPMIFVDKKNVSVLKKIYTSLKNINTSKNDEKINHSILMIDDEADYASINTNPEENDPTKINEYIRKILSLFRRNSYVGFTATPFANVFIKYDNEDDMLKDDLFPKDFIYSLNSPSNYYGSKKYFFNKNSNVVYIKDCDEQIFPISHKKDWNGDNLFPSFYHSINVFLINNAIRDIRDKNKNTHRSMLINMSRFIDVQNVICGIVEEYFKNMKTAIYSTHKRHFNDSMTNPLIKSLYNSFKLEYSNIEITWNKLFSKLYDAIKDIQIIVVNSKQTTAKLNYDNSSKGLRVIAIGGIALSRGLTLEGLNVSYFYRNTTTFDVLMQMGRWFGYRDDYKDLCKIFITYESANHYKYIYNSIECLREDIKKMNCQHKKPEEYGIRVLNDSRDLNITAYNKRRYTSAKVVKKSYFGSVFETPYIHRNLDLIEQNIDNTFSFLSSINEEQKDLAISYPYFRNIPKSNVVDFLGQLQIHPANENFDTKQLVKFLKRHNYTELNNFDILIMKGYSKKPLEYKKLNINIPLVCRTYDIKENSVIRMNTQRAHLMGRLDTKNGLSKEQQNLIGENARAQDFMIKERNPLLIIYFVEPTNNNTTEDIDYAATYIEDDKNFLNELRSRKYNFLIGYAIGFPSNESYNSKDEKYEVNKTVNYYEKEHEEEQGDDCNE